MDARSLWSILRWVICGAFCLLGACVDDDGSSLFISAQVAGDDECVYAVGNNRVLRGQFNAETRDDYSVFALVNNQLRNLASNAPIRTDPNGVRLEEAEVRIEDADGDAISFTGLANPFSVPMGDFVASAVDSGSPGQTVAALQGIPPAYADVLQASLGADPTASRVIVLRVRVLGTTNGDVSVKSQEWRWPVTVCQGQCLFTSATLDTTCCTPGQDFTCEL